MVRYYKVVMPDGDLFGMFRAESEEAAKDQCQFVLDYYIGAKLVEMDAEDYVQTLIMAIAPIGDME